MKTSVFARGLVHLFAWNSQSAVNQNATENVPDEYTIEASTQEWAERLFRVVDGGPEKMREFIRKGGTFAHKVYSDDRSVFLRKMRRKFSLGEDIVLKEGVIDPGKYSIYPKMENKGISLAMYVASKGPEAINVFIEGGGKFDDYRDNRNRDAGLMAAEHSVEAMEAFVNAGGRFSSAQDKFDRWSGYTRTAEYTQECRDKISDSNFFKNTDVDWDIENCSFIRATYDWDPHAELKLIGHLAASKALQYGVRGVDVFKRGGGKFKADSRFVNLTYDEVNQTHITSDITISDCALMQGLDVARAYVDAGGRFLSESAEYAAEGGPEMMQLFHSNGGIGVLSFGNLARLIPWNR